jgi:hypothetical protein
VVEVNEQGNEVSDMSGASREYRLEVALMALMALVEQFDSGEIEGGGPAFAEARVVLEESGKLTFSSWLARVESELGVEEVEPEAYLKYYESGLSAAEGVLAERMESDVLTG